MHRTCINVLCGLAGIRIVGNASRHWFVHCTYGRNQFGQSDDCKISGCFSGHLSHMQWGSSSVLGHGKIFATQRSVYDRLADAGRVHNVGHFIDHDVKENIRFFFVK